MQFVGKPKSISYIDDGDSIQKIILSSEQNVLAMINGKNGVLGGVDCSSLTTNKEYVIILLDMVLM